jgi:hypothetical protein
MAVVLLSFPALVHVSHLVVCAVAGITEHLIGNNHAWQIIFPNAVGL